jgi:uncharacterized protein YdcH (DUF465 family)
MEVISMGEKELKELLIKESEEFKNVYERHQQCEKELEQLKNKDFHTDQDRLIERELKKRKLALKDRMYLIMTNYRRSLQ